MSAAAPTAGMIGGNAVTLEAFAFVAATPGNVRFPNVPEPLQSVTAERVLGAIAATGIALPALHTEVTRNHSSAPIQSTPHDVAYAIAILIEHGAVPLPVRRIAFLGELTNAGALAPVRGIYPMVRALAADHYSAVVVPAANAAEASLVAGIQVIACADLADVLTSLGVTVKRTPANTAVRDFATIHGNAQAVRAAVIAAAGDHHLRLTGSVKHADTIIAAMAGIMPTLDGITSEEATIVASLRGTIGRHRVTEAPYVATRDTDSMASLLGGGARFSTPGAVSGAHGGILHLSDACEYPTAFLATLRQPLHTGEITLYRSQGAATFPARFLLALSTRDCPCGQASCDCTPLQRSRYLARLKSLPCDLALTAAVRSHATGEPAPNTATLAAAVKAARAAAAARFADQSWNTNARASTKWLRKHTPKPVMDVVDDAHRGGRINAAAADALMRLAWTAADVDGADAPTIAHLEVAHY